MTQLATDPHNADRDAATTAAATTTMTTTNHLSGSGSALPM
jgi:hypothetical protein